MPSPKPRCAVEIDAERWTELLTLSSTLSGSLETLMKTPKTAALDQVLAYSGALENALNDAWGAPLDALFEDLPQMVQGLGAITQKRIELKVNHPRMKVPRAVIRKLRPSLVALIRNAIDHGLEPPDERGEKPAAGQLHIEAKWSKGGLSITVQDDGRGVDIPAIKRAAFQLGLSASEDAELDLETLLEPGIFSTTHRASLSGRGVGLTLVDTDVGAMGGSIRILTEQSKGTSARLWVPLQRARMAVVIFSCAGQQFAVPESQVVEISTGPRLKLRHQERVFSIGIDEVLDIELATITSHPEQKNEWIAVSHDSIPCLDASSLSKDAGSATELFKRPPTASAITLETAQLYFEVDGEERSLPLTVVERLEICAAENVPKDSVHLVREPTRFGETRVIIFYNDGVQRLRFVVERAMDIRSKTAEEALPLNVSHFSNVSALATQERHQNP